MKLYETINERNWRKGWKIDGGRGCLLWHVRGAGGHSSLRLEGLHEAIRSLYPLRSEDGCITSFNDHPDTTVEDVIRVCKVADV